MLSPRPLLPVIAMAIVPLMSIADETTRLVPAAAPAVRVAYSASHPRALVVKDGKFLLDGKPFQFVCGEMHYNRIPRELWRDRLHKAKVMGINCVSAYVFWSFHEKAPGQFDFTGNADVAEFIRIAHAEGLLVYLRPGPYVCAEYDFGGYPYWLLNIKDLKWRSRDPAFLALMQRYIDALAGQLKDLQLDRGGPIAFVQVENEYGSYGSDKVYLAAIRDMIKKAGFTAMLTTCDGGGQMGNGKVDGCLPTINGALGNDIKTTVDRHLMGGPYFVSEFYPAWFDEWGKRHSRKSIEASASQFDWMLAHDVNVSIYMFHGGTNFWYTNGANNHGSYAPQPTSYDYDAPLGEYGNMTPKFMAMRAVVEKNKINGVTLPPVPPQPKVVTVPAFTLGESCPLTAACGKPVESENPLTMEALGQDFGYVLYRTTLTTPGKGTLVCDELRDFGVVYLDGKQVGRMDRRHNQNSIDLVVTKVPATLEILVENVGRINYGPHLLINHKGITKSVSFNGRALTGWDNIPLPLHRAGVGGFTFGKPIKDVPAFHRGEFDLKERGEVFLDLGAWGKGAVWVNGHSMGKFWSIGPQQTMYVPSCWLKIGRNEVIVFELDDRGVRTIAGLAEPVLDKLQKDPDGNRKPRRDGANPRLEQGDLVAVAALDPGGQPQPVKFTKPVTARHLAVEITATHGNTRYSHLAGIEVLGADGHPLPHKEWKIWFADSEEMAKENGRAEHAIDGNPRTLWHTAYSDGEPACPHVLVLDLGDIHQDISGISITARADKAEGNPAQVRVFARPQFFLAR